jgi:hypothetical protein
LPSFCIGFAFCQILNCVCKRGPGPPQDAATSRSVRIGPREWCHAAWLGLEVEQFRYSQSARYLGSYFFVFKAFSSSRTTSLSDRRIGCARKFISSSVLLDDCRISVGLPRTSTKGREIRRPSDKESFLERRLRREVKADTRADSDFLRARFS